MERVECNIRKDDYVLCMRGKFPANSPAQHSSYVGCYPIHSLKDFYQYHSEYMQIRYCVAVCLTVDGSSYVGLNNEDCYCIQSLEVTQITAASNKPFCNLTCSGNPTNVCGGLNSYSVYDLQYYSSNIVTDCKGFYDLGFYPSRLKSQALRIKSKGMSQSVICNRETLFQTKVNIDPCPNDYFMFNNSCLYFGRESESSNDAHRLCQNLGGDLATPESYEIPIIANTVRRPYTHSMIDSWHLGGFTVNGLWTWRDGRPFIDEQFSGIKVKNWDGKSVYGGCQRYTLRRNDQIVDEVELVDCSIKTPAPVGFVCKRNNQFLGFAPMDQNALKNSRVSYSSQLMSVTACNQLCLLQGTLQVAQVMYGTCTCSPANSRKKAQQMPFNCTRPISCLGNGGQICGCDKLNFAVYSADESVTPKYNSCEQLKQNGVRVNGVYTLWPSSSSPRGNPEFCELNEKEGGCPEKYIGYRGKCYQMQKTTMTNKEATRASKSQKAKLPLPDDDPDEKRFLVNFAAKLGSKVSAIWLSPTKGGAANAVYDEGECHILSIKKGSGEIRCSDINDDGELHAVFQLGKTSIQKRIEVLSDISSKIAGAILTT